MERERERQQSVLFLAQEALGHTRHKQVACDEANGHPLHESIVRGVLSDNPLDKLVVCGELTLWLLPDSMRESWFESELASCSGFLRATEESRRGHTGVMGVVNAPNFKGWHPGLA